MGLKSYFHLKQVGHNFRQNWSTQLMGLLTVSLSVLIFSFFLLIYLNVVNAGARLGDELRLVVYLDKEVEPALKPLISNKIAAYAKVERVLFISQTEAFNRLQKQLDREKELLADLGPEFLPPSIEVYPEKSFRNFTRLKEFSEFLATLPGAQKVQYGQEWLERFGYFTELLRVIVGLSGILLVLATGFMVSCTIRLTVVAKENELEILRLVGASNRYIQAPLFFEGILQGLIGSTLGLTMLYAIFRWTRSHLGGSSFLNLLDYTFLPLSVTATVVGGATLLCAWGSLLSIRKHMRI
ncbi:MAG TPA: permease-like cell division protein FtsX [Desulfurivibrionaceae bacterium]|nr:permease-like cell division protein FtsX [Desulfurivibrionaceae bacterium]